MDPITGALIIVACLVTSAFFSGSETALLGMRARARGGPARGARAGRVRDARELPAERGDTLAGLVFHELGRAPRKGDVVRVPGYELSVADTSGTRIRQVRVAECSGDAP